LPLSREDREGRDAALRSLKKTVGEVTEIIELELDAITVDDSTRPLRRAQRDEIRFIEVAVRGIRSMLQDSAV
jgi:hypothetical protein